MAGKTFIELASASIQENRKIVISKLSDADSFTLAQQVTIQEGSRDISMFMKGAIHIDGKEGLEALHRALGKALERAK